MFLKKKKSSTPLPTGVGREEHCPNIVEIDRTIQDQDGYGETLGGQCAGIEKVQRASDTVDQKWNDVKKAAFRKGKTRLQGGAVDRVPEHLPGDDQRNCARNVIDKHR
jgi:hypothetical protein